MRILLALALCAGAVAAGDLTGKWKGTAEITAPDGRAMSRPALLDLVQNGGNVTGKMGPDEQRMQPVQNAKLEGNALTFDAAMGPDRSAKVALTVVDDKTMEGTVEGTMHTGDAFKAKVKFVREAAAAAGSFTGTWSGRPSPTAAHEHGRQRKQHSYDSTAHNQASGRAAFMRR